VPALFNHHFARDTAAQPNAQDSKAGGKASKAKPGKPPKGSAGDGDVKNKSQKRKRVESQAAEDGDGDGGNEDAAPGDGDVELQTPAKLKAHPRWRPMEPLVKSYIGNLVHFLKQLVDPQMVRYVIVHAKPAIPYVVPFPKVATKLVKVRLLLMIA